MRSHCRLSFPARAWLAALWLAAGVAHAQPDTFWCGSQLVREGMTAVEISRRCGEPDTVQVIEEPIFARNANGSTRQIGVTMVEIWTYNRGSGRFPARIRVADGVATEVELIRQ
ncbi:MAG TPA: DUF2845 domain-containing protein [Gammaproteobacteria bacterium]|nr:DUF2845 domain-containing protein [Gammaproteobacteria bacterium]